MQICILCVGKIKEKYFKLAIDEYLKRLTPYVKLEIVEVPDESEPQQLNSNLIIKIKEKEAKKLVAKLKPDDFIVCMCIDGNSIGSKDFATFFNTRQNMATKRVVFVIGGSHGIDDSIVSMASMKISLSKMTFPHQLARVLLLEQIYRAYKINANESYHK